MERKYIDTSESDEFANDTVCTECYNGTIAEMNCNDGKWRCEECADKWAKAGSIESLQTQLTQEREKMKGLIREIESLDISGLMKSDILGYHVGKHLRGEEDFDLGYISGYDLTELIQKYKTDEQTR